MEMGNEKTKLFAILLRKVCNDVADFAGKLYCLADGVADEGNPECETIPHFLLNDDEKDRTQGCQAVDLGLPSGLKWADRNVGAASPEDFGDYFAWGETSPRGEDWATEAPYDLAHAPFNGGSSFFNEVYFNEHKTEWLTEDGTLKPEYDAAHVIMGGSWRMPTSAEMQELIDGTTQSVEELNGVKGMRFTSEANGNSIFMPFAGYRYGSDVYSVGLDGYAWSSSLYAGYADDSHYLNFYDYGSANVNNGGRYVGFAVRGVHE